jgi:hypothetical protein
MPIRVLYCAILLASLALTGCAHLGQRVQRGPVPPGASKTVLRDILADLAANEAALRTFKAHGSFTVKTPESAAVQQCSGLVLFRKPSDLFVVGSGPLGGKVFELRCLGDRYLIWYNGERQIRSAGQSIEGISWKVSPADVAREIFLPESWSQVAPDSIRLLEHDDAAHKAVFLLGAESAPRRRVEVAGPPWDVVKTELSDPKTGQVVARTNLNDYREKAGVRYPTKIIAEFPVQGARLTFDITGPQDPELNTQLDDSRFTIKEADTK